VIDARDDGARGRARDGDAYDDAYDDDAYDGAIVKYARWRMRVTSVRARAFARDESA